MSKLQTSWSFLFPFLYRVSKRNVSVHCLHLLPFTSQSSYIIAPNFLLKLFALRSPAGPKLPTGISTFLLIIQNFCGSLHAVDSSVSLHTLASSFLGAGTHWILFWCCHISHTSCRSSSRVPLLFLLF